MEEGTTESIILQQQLQVDKKRGGQVEYANLGVLA